MRRAIIFLVVVLLASCALADVREFKYFSLDVPEGWNAHEEGSTVTVEANDGSGSLVIASGVPEGQTLEEIASKYSREVGGSEPERDDDGNYTFEFNDGRSQVIVTGYEEFFMIIVGNGIDSNDTVLGTILESLEMK